MGLHTRVDPDMRACDELLVGLEVIMHGPGLDTVGGCLLISLGNGLRMVALMSFDGIQAVMYGLDHALQILEVLHPVVGSRC